MPLLTSLGAYLSSILTSKSFLFDNVCFVAGLVILLSRRPRQKRDWARLAGDMLGLFAAWFLCWAVLRMWWDTPWVGTAADIIILTAYKFLRRDYPLKARIICAMVYLSCYILLIGMNYELSVILSQWQGISEEVALGSLLICVGIICVIVSLRHWHPSHVTDHPRSYMVLMITISVLSVVIQLVNFNLSDIDGLIDAQGLLLLVNGCFLVIQLMAYYFYYTIGRQMAEREEWMALQHKEELEQDILATARQTYESLSELRHEIKNHDSYMAALLDQEDYEGLRAYFEQYRLGHADAVRFVHSGNDTVDALVNNRMTRASMLGVRLETMLALPPELPIPEKDLCSLLSNLLDNAAEGCAAYDGEEERRVLFHMRLSGGYLFLRTENPVSSKAEVRRQRLSLKTTKPSAALHGYGTKIIRRLAARYSGAAKFQIKEDQFVVDVMLCLQEKEVPQNG